MYDIKVVTHYSKDDTRCIGDYIDIEVFVDGRLAIKYGDYYHDKGQEKAVGFIDAIKYSLNPKPEIVKEEIADREI